jgi:hypothetical protein
VPPSPFPTTSTIDSAPSSQYSSHRYNTRFRRRILAKSASTLSSDSHIDPTLYTALLAAQESPLSLDPQFSTQLAFAASNNPDVLHYGRMQHDPDRPHFEKDMQREIHDLFASDTVEITPRSSLPPNVKPLKAIWSFRRKRAPDWTILKHKSRICPDGGEQIEGLNFWETYAPVVSWRTVRLILTLSLLADLKSRQVDYVQAYTQAPADCDLFMNIPAGFIVEHNKLIFTSSSTKNNSANHVLRIKKNMYGLKQAGNNWFDVLRHSLLQRGFTQSSYDPCLFIRKDCILIVYVDDCLLFAKTDAVLDSLIASLQKDFVLTSEGSVGAFLGIDICRTSEGHLHLTQQGLIDKIITACGLQDQSAEHNIPANVILSADTAGPSREHSWNYRSVIGMLTYLASSTRPDIAFAVHQCARFSVAPRRLHELAVRRIVRYLKGTRDKGYILTPSTSPPNLDCFVDADFAGTWTTATSHDPSSVKSRTGYVITFASCPVLWCSKLQSEIALSTTEAEYIALSQATRDLIPLRGLLTELSTTTKLIVGSTVAHSTIFEDNKGCVELALAPKLRPRTRHIAIKYHHFRSHVEKGHLHIKWIDTKHQLADIFTKPLPHSSFSTLRRKLIGW